jgi:hypothetical protein
MMMAEPQVRRFDLVLPRNCGIGKVIMAAHAKIRELGDEPEETHVRGSRPHPRDRNGTSIYFIDARVWVGGNKR